MSKLDEIEKSLERSGTYVVDGWAAMLLVRAVRQLGAIVRTANMVAGSDIVDWGLGLKALRREIVDLDPDVLDLISPDQISTVESKG